MPIRALLFDVYGTLLDVHGLTGRIDALLPGHGSSVSALWRTKQIDYTRLRTLSGRHADFMQVTGDGLDFALEKLGLSLSSTDRAALLGAYETLPAHADAAPALELLARKGIALGVLSNGTPAMLHAGLAASGLGALLPTVLSIEAVGKYKTAPEAYQLGPDAFGVGAGEIGFVSSNAWDAVGAGWFGFRTFWCNRSGEPMERLGIAPDCEGRGLAEVAAWVARG